MRLRCFLFLPVASAMLAQNKEGVTSGFIWSEEFDGSLSSLGAITRLDTAFGYQFGPRFSVVTGLPAYFVQPSSTLSAATGTTTPWAKGIGNVYGQFRLSLPNDVVDFTSTLTATAPTGNKSEGFSTGHATIDWTNDFGRSFGRVRPFGGIGFANSVSDTLFFVRPYITSGFVTHANGGFRYQLAKKLAIGAYAYGIAPSGTQTVVSRVVRSNVASVATTTTATGAPSATGPGNFGGKGNSVGAAGMGNDGNSANANSKRRVFETAPTTTGTATIARDYGYAAFARFSPTPNLNVSVGYTRSAQFALNTLFFGVGVTLNDFLRHGQYAH